MIYDGSGKLTEAIAELYGLSTKSVETISKHIGAAKNALGIGGKARIMSSDVKMAIYQWHYDKLNPVQSVKQVDVYNVKHADIVQDVKQEIEPDSDGDIVQYIKQEIPVNEDDSAVYDVKQDNLESDAGAVYDFDHIHFAITVVHQGKSKRTTIMLERYLVKAMQHKHELVNNAAIRQWLEQLIKADAIRFDSYAPLTRQVKRLIIESLV